jgi:hypothetical protein
VHHVDNVDRHGPLKIKCVYDRYYARPAELLCTRYQTLLRSPSGRIALRWWRGADEVDGKAVSGAYPGRGRSAVIPRDQFTGGTAVCLG